MKPKLDRSATKILVVEDEPLVAEDIQSCLTNFGYKTISVLSSGEEVIANFKALAPDCMLMDVNLSGKLDGISTVMQLQKDYSVPVVFLTALSDEETLQRAKLTNPYGFLLKPFAPDELHSAIELTLHRFVATPEEDKEEELDRKRVEEVLRSHTCFAEANAKALSYLLANSQVKNFEAGQFVTFEGEDANGGFVTLSGRVSIIKGTETGKELTVALMAQGDPTGLFFALPEFARTGSAKCQIASKILWFNRHTWDEILKLDPTIMARLCGALSRRLSAAYELASGLAHTRVEKRILTALRVLLQDFGKPSGKSPSEGRIFITRRELAELTGTTPETAIRITKQLERDGILDLTRPGIIKILDATLLQ